MAKECLEILAPAKINLALAVTGLRDDGFHNLQTVFQTISLYDCVRVELKKEGLSCSCGEYSGEQNLAYRAVDLFLKELALNGTPIDAGIHIDIKKNIPVQAGLGGGSSDAAAALQAANEIFDKPLSAVELLKIAQLCGSDTAFCFLQGTYWGEGTGINLERLPDISRMNIVLVKPQKGVDTREAYRLFDILGQCTSLDKEKWLTAIQTASIDLISDLLYNSLESVSIRLVPEIGLLKSIMLEEGCLGTLMSGSGSAVFGIVRDYERGIAVKRRLFNEGFNKVWQVQTVNPSQDK